MPFWNELAESLFGRASVALINPNTSPMTAQRFDVHRFPHIILLKKGKFYVYNGEYDAKEFEKFLENYQTMASEKGEVP